MLVLGEIVSESFSLVSLATGQTFTRTSSYINNVASVWNPTITEISGGFYRYSYTPLVAGSFEWAGLATNGEAVTINFEIEATGVTVTISAATTGALTQTLAQLRRRVARRLGDYVALTATANGTTTTIVDTQRINTATQDMTGRVVVSSNGTNSGLSRFITAQVDATGTLTVAALTTGTLTNDTFDVYNKRGKGFLPTEYDSAINDAINDAYPLGMIEVAATISTVFDSDVPDVTVPASLTYVHTVQWLDDDSRPHAIPMSRRGGEYGWYPNSTAGTITVYGRFGTDIDGLTIVLIGYGRQATLSANADTCALNAEYIVDNAAYHLAHSALDKDRDFYGTIVGQINLERIRTRVRTLGNRGLPVRAA